jgi:MFS superfamily sulfate permease-like transporter
MRRMRINAHNFPKVLKAFQISGPLFFGVANRLDDVLNQFTTTPRIFILRMRIVPLIDVAVYGRCANGFTGVREYAAVCREFFRSNPTRNDLARLPAERSGGGGRRSVR